MEHWSEYWNNPGVLNSFTEGEQGKGYQGTVTRTWQSLLSDLQPGSNILDIGSGNGGLAVLALGVSEAENKNFKITATDAAKIDPVKQFAHQPNIAEKLKKISFYGQTPTEDLQQFEDSSFDAVVSQFGFEYTNFEKSVPEIIRTLKKGGQFGAVCHSSNSAIVDDCKAGYEFLDYLLTQTPIFPLTEVILLLAEEALPQLGDEAFQDYKIYKVQRNSVLWCVQHLKTEFRGEGYAHWLEDLEHRIKSVFDNLTNKRLGDIRRFLRFHYDQLNNQKVRIKEQAQAALNETEIEQLKALFSQNGLSLNAAQLSLEENVQGWLLTATK
ncbi:class I SAM-dependent methyltransferase [uncultured Idiomarina sp.]|uniref:class I SAM-dependent methyltransferase n=1 Tax=uncultured Idiomarina sp. TaxID=352961 RepID=UPI002591DDB0|nr:class I SAM-dependent methyltransferase [uncultured Idiomarina sp.]